MNDSASLIASGVPMSIKGASVLKTPIPIPFRRKNGKTYKDTSLQCHILRITIVPHTSGISTNFSGLSDIKSFIALSQLVTMMRDDNREKICNPLI